MNDGISETITIRMLRHTGETALYVIALALPWEIFQRLPSSGLTLVKIAGMFVIIAAAGIWIQTDRKTSGKRFRVFRTGMEYPLLLFLSICAFSSLYSLDRTATFFQLRVYLAYLLFFYAAAYLVTSGQMAHRLFILYIFSGLVVALLTIIESRGWLWPVFWDTPWGWSEKQLLYYFRQGIPMRIAATSIDFNQGALYLLVGFGASLFLSIPTRQAPWYRYGLMLVSVVFFIALLYTMSRSALLIAAGMIILFPATLPIGKNKRWLFLFFSAIPFCIILTFMLVRPNFFLLFLERIQEGLTLKEGSARGRLLVYRLAWHLVPQYSLKGCGLGAIDTAMARSPYAEDAVMTLHSMPFKILLELGIPGLLAYGWVVFRGIWIPWKRMSNQENQASTRAFIATAISIFLLTLVQPFPFLPHYPFLLSLGFGPLVNTWKDKPDSPPRKQGAPFLYPLMIALVLAAGIIGINFIYFQCHAGKMIHFSDCFTAGEEAENNARWHEAETAFREAESIATAEHSFQNYAYHAILENLVELRKLYLQPEKFLATPKNIQAADMARAMRARITLIMGDTDKAETILSTLQDNGACSRNILFMSGNVLWQQGKYALAIRAYQKAATCPPVMGDLVYQARKRLESLGKAPSLPEQLERAMLLRKLGKWEDAISLYREIWHTNAGNPGAADACFNLGVSEEIKGNPQKALSLYKKTLRLLPCHFAAKRRIYTLEKESKKTHERD